MPVLSKRKSAPDRVKLTADKLLDSVGVRRELDRFQTLGGKVLMERSTIILIPNIVPDYIADTFAERIKRLDTDNALIIIVRSYI